MIGKKQNRTWQKTERNFNRYVLPNWGMRPLSSIKPRDLRRTIGTNMAGHFEISVFTVARVLNHAEGGVTKIYARASCLKEKRMVLEKWAACISQVIEGGGETIVSFEGRVSGR